jgi:probable HAF family extracellular repeat protein
MLYLLTRLVGFVGLLMLASTPVSADGYTYTVTNMGQFSPMAINNAGKVIGTSGSVFGVEQAVLYSDGKLKNLGSLDEESSYAMGINDAGEVVGYVFTGAGPHRAFFYSGDTMSDLNSLVAPGSVLALEEAVDINNHGVIVGTGSTATEGNHIFQYGAGAANDLGKFGVTNAVDAINDNGEFVGAYTTASGIQKGFLSSGGILTDVGLGGNVTYAMGINSLGQVVGSTIFADYSIHAYIYSGGTTTDIDPNGTYSSADAINDLGVIAGSGPNNHAYIFIGGQMQDLNSMIDPGLGITLYGATGINNEGQIIALGGDANYNSFGYLLTPVPEPPSILLLSAGFFALFVCSLRRLKRGRESFLLTRVVGVGRI